MGHLLNYVRKKIVSNLQANSVINYKARIEFMTEFDTEIKKELKYFSGMWLRQLDDVFTICGTKYWNIYGIISLTNKTLQSIKFPCDKVSNEQLICPGILSYEKFY